MTTFGYYVAAHADDALLFHGDQLYTDLHSEGVTVVHIVTCAGDAGRTDGWWQARERGLVAAMTGTLSPSTVISETVTLGGKVLQRYRAPGWVLFCLRLPDGGTFNTGYPSTGGNTLGKLSTGTGPLTAVDGTATYNTWAEFVAVIKAIFVNYKSATTHWINTSDPDAGNNPSDHPDHYATAKAARSAAVALGLNRYFWVSYDTQNRPVNLDGDRLDAKRFLFARYGRQCAGPNEGEWAAWGVRSYGRIEYA